MQIVKEKPVVLESEDGVWLSMDHIYQLSEITSELLVAKNQLTLEQKEKIHENSESMELIKKIEKISERLQKYSNDVRKVKVIPPYSDLHVILRQLSNELNKEVDFTVVGGDIELDRLVVKDIHTCLIHLIRNSLDHGLEDLLTRVEHGKPPKGQVQIEISESHGKIILLYSDDGQGLDRERILNKIIEKEVATPEAAALMTDQQIFQSIFLSGLSTKAVPNFVSGRGIGMDVVHDIFVNKYKGNISLESEKNQGVRFRFQFQMQNQIQIEKTLVGVSQKICVGAPISALWSVQAVDDLSINQVGEVRCIQFQGKTIPTFFYKELIERKISLKQNINPGSFVWIFYGRQNPFGILIDAMETQQDLVIKPISQFIQDMIVFKGASVLSNKEICYIFDEYKIEEVLNEYK
jgi:two-component system chemotaxis sensor kinase CheA